MSRFIVWEGQTVKLVRTAEVEIGDGDGSPQKC
jgi:hypothetical protein